MKHILLLLANGFEIYEASVFIDVMGWNLLEGDKSTKLKTASFQKEVTSTFNQKISVDITIDQIEINDYDALAIPGGFEEFGFYKDAFSPAFANIIKSFHNEGKTIASICTGGICVANSGILENQPGTTYNMNNTRLEELKGLGVKLLDQPIVQTNNIITSQNPATAIDVAFLLLEKLTSKENTNAVKRLMGFKAT